MDIKKFALLAADALDNKKASDILILDIAQKSQIADYMILATGTNERAIGAQADEVEDALYEAGLNVRSIEGKKESGWILLDFGDLIINILTKEKRENYNIESVWADCETLKWEAN